MVKKIHPRSTPTAVKIHRAAMASRLMTHEERLQIMFKAGLLTQEEMKKATNPETAEKAK